MADVIRTYVSANRHDVIRTYGHFGYTRQMATLPVFFRFLTFYQFADTNSIVSS